MDGLSSGQETTLVISKGFEIEKSRRYAKSEILVWFNLFPNHDFITSLEEDASMAIVEIASFTVSNFWGVAFNASLQASRMSQTPTGAQ